MELWQLGCSVRAQRRSRKSSLSCTALIAQYPHRLATSPFAQFAQCTTTTAFLLHCCTINTLAAAFALTPPQSPRCHCNRCFLRRPAGLARLPPPGGPHAPPCPAAPPSRSAAPQSAAQETAGKKRQRDGLAVLRKQCRKQAGCALRLSPPITSAGRAQEGARLLPLHPPARTSSTPHSYSASWLLRVASL